jgi:hypothetical protein
VARIFRLRYLVTSEPEETIDATTGRPAPMLSAFLVIRTSHMDQSLENRTRERAYEIWAAHGYVHGQADQHWFAAEREILAASTVVLVREPAPQKKRRLPARSKTTTTRAVAG